MNLLTNREKSVLALILDTLRAVETRGIAIAKFLGHPPKMAGELGTYGVDLANVIKRIGGVFEVDTDAATNFLDDTDMSSLAAAICEATDPGQTNGLVIKRLSHLLRGVKIVSWCEPSNELLEIVRQSKMSMEKDSDVRKTLIYAALEPYRLQFDFINQQKYPSLTETDRLDAWVESVSRTIQHHNLDDPMQQLDFLERLKQRWTLEAVSRVPGAIARRRESGNVPSESEVAAWHVRTLSDREKALLSILLDTMRAVEKRGVEIAEFIGYGSKANEMGYFGINLDATIDRIGETFGIDVQAPTDANQALGDDTTSLAAAVCGAMYPDKTNDLVFQRVDTLLERKRAQVVA